LQHHEALIRSEVQAQPDITLSELAEKAAKVTKEPEVSLMKMSEELRRLGLGRKKR